ncbi:TonB-dependent receptor [Sphingomonas sp.]|uniref:TonB-dependent receptor n=1 Tax=Sphingomonas sp. TaxID=28214 RepID=UPI0025EC945F|nr:TonB-dependent receptor [Sphingomonas sp.]
MMHERANGGFVSERWSASAFALVVALLAAPTQAQEKAASASGSSQTPAVTKLSDKDPTEANSGIIDIVVTARKQSESIQQVPIAITAFSAEQLVQQRVFEVKNLGEITPGLVAAGDKQRGFPVVRGITTRSPNIGAEGAVGQYVDEVYQPRFSNQFTALLDMERVEVLKGPQGTLFGRNTVAGAINYVSKKPTDELTASVSVGAGNYGLFESRGSVAGPLVPGKLDAGLSFMTNNSRGFIKAVDASGHILGDDGRDDYGLRGTLKWTPTDKLEANLSVSRIKTKSAQLELTEGNPSGPTVPALVRLGLYKPSPFVANYHDFRVGATTPGRLDRTSTQATLRADWHLSDDLTLTSISAYQKFNEGLVADADLEVQNIAVTTSYEHSNTWSQEVRLAGGDNVFHWNVGGNYFYDDHYRSDDIDLTVLPAPYNIHVFSSTKVKTTSYAAFGKAYFSPIDRLTISGGIRYSYDRRQYRRISLPGNAAFGATYDSNLVPGWDTDPHWDAITYDASIDYRVTPNAMVYFSHSKGYRSGGIQGRAQTLIVAESNYGPEYIRQYEVGAKTEFFKRHLQLNVAAYYMPYKNVQVSQAQIATFFGGIAIQNAASATVKGVEVEAKLQATKRLRVDVGYSYNDSHYKNFTATDNIPASIAAVRGCPAAYGCKAGDYQFSGVPFEFAPKNTLSTAINYDVVLPNAYKVSLRGEYNWKSSYLLNSIPQSVYARPTAYLDAKFLRQPSYGLLNTFVTIEMPNHRWSLSLYGRNLTNETYLTVGSDPRTAINGQFNKFVYADRRTYGFDVGFRF